MLLFHICVPCLEHFSPSTWFLFFFLCVPPVCPLPLSLYLYLFVCVHPSLLLRTPYCLHLNLSLSPSSSSSFHFQFLHLLLVKFYYFDSGCMFFVWFSPYPNLRNYPVVAIVVVAIGAQRAGASNVRVHARAREHFRNKKRSKAIKDLCIKMKKFFFTVYTMYTAYIFKYIVRKWNGIERQFEMPKIEVDEATQKGEKPLNFERRAKHTDTQCKESKRNRNGTKETRWINKHTWNVLDWLRVPLNAI